MKIDSRKTSLTDFIRVESSDLFEKTNQFRHFADDMRERDLEKYLLRRMSRAGSRAVTLDERTGETQTVQVYCSADYLDLAQDPDVLAAAKEATDTFGASISSVPLILSLIHISEPTRPY